MGRSGGRSQNAPSYKELLAIDGEPIEFEWNVLLGFSSLQILQKIQENLRERNIKPEGFTDRIIFMSMFNDIDWTTKGNDGICISNSDFVKKYAKRFSQGHWTFLGLGDADRYTCRTLHVHMYSDCTDHAARMHVYIGTSLSCVPKIGHSSTRHVSPCASQYTEHQHKFSLTNLSCVTFVHFSDSRPVVHASIYPL